jgi:hypothetical protein
VWGGYSTPERNNGAIGSTGRPRNCVWTPSILRKSSRAHSSKRRQRSPGRTGTLSSSEVGHSGICTDRAQHLRTARMEAARRARTDYPDNRAPEILSGHPLSAVRSDRRLLHDRRIHSPNSPRRRERPRSPDSQENERRRVAPPVGRPTPTHYPTPRRPTRYARDRS